MAWMLHGVGVPAGQDSAQRQTEVVRKIRQAGWRARRSSRQAGSFWVIILLTRREMKDGPVALDQGMMRSSSNER
jgi:hypothetical protein